MTEYIARAPQSAGTRISPFWDVVGISLLAPCAFRPLVPRQRRSGSATHRRVLQSADWFAGQGKNGAFNSIPGEAAASRGHRWV